MQIQNATKIKVLRNIFKCLFKREKLFSYCAWVSQLAGAVPHISILFLQFLFVLLQSVAVLFLMAFFFKSDFGSRKRNK